MDGFDTSSAPQAYQEVKWIADTFVALMGVGWIINYVGMVRVSFRDQTYGMAIIPLCCNIAWEIVYTFVHPSKNRVEQLAFFLGVLINLGVMYTAIKFSPREWAHAPIVKNNLPLIFVVGVFGCLTGHLALAAEIGPALAYSWGAVICQLLLSVGGLAQLLARGSTRGGSYILWLSRFLGSCCTVAFTYYRFMYWPEAFSWLSSPLVLWSLGAFLATDLSYGVCFHLIRQMEIEEQRANAAAAAAIPEKAGGRKRGASHTTIAMGRYDARAYVP